jgi:hypothetical protein
MVSDSMDIHNLSPFLGCHWQNAKGMIASRSYHGPGRLEDFSFHVIHRQETK